MEPEVEITGLVYYVMDATRRVQYVKIGYTLDLSGRLHNLRRITACGQIPLVLALEGGALATERARHHQFAELRSHGEWFRYEDPLREFIAAMDHPFAYLLDRPNLWTFAASWGPISPDAGGQSPNGKRSYRRVYEPRNQDEKVEEYVGLSEVDHVEF